MELLMDKENVAYIYNGIVFSCKETTISYEMEVAGNNHSE